MALSVNPGAKSFGLGGRIVGTLFFSVFFLMGLGFEIMIARQTLNNLATYGWRQAEAVITAAAVLPPRDDESDPVLQVRYAYTAGGAALANDRIEAGARAFETSDAYRLAEHYAIGKCVPCWVNPNDPAEAVLQRKNPATALIVLFPLIFVAVGVIGIWAMWRTKGAPNADAASATPISSRVKGFKSGRWLKAVFFALFLLIGAGVGWAIFVGPLLRIVASRAWIAVPCEVVSSRVKTHSSDDGSTYSVEVVYRYVYQGRTYRSNRRQFMTGSSSGYGAKAEAVRRLGPGTQLTCYVDPQEPAEAVLNREPTAGLWFGLIPLVFVLVGAGGVWHSLRQKPVLANGMFTTGQTTFQPATGLSGEGPQALQPAVSPKAKLIGVLLVAAFWNGIVSVFLYNLFSEARHGDFSWFLALFLVPFVLVGLGLIGGVVYQCMALFNPSLRLTLRSGMARPGDTLDLSWELSGRAEVLRRLQITLEGREEAIYRRGTDTRTDKEVFATLQIVDTADTIAMHSGAAKLTVPPGAMHSFKAKNNKIVWVLKVHGDIPRWPDIKDEYPFTVAPHAAKTSGSSAS